MDREEFKEKAKATLDDIFLKIDELDAKKDKLKGDVRAEYDQRIFELKVKKAELEMEVDALGQEAEEKWEAVKQSFSSGSESIREGLSKVRSLFR